MIAPVSTPASTQWMVVPVFVAPAASASRTAWAPGKSGNKAGWLFTILNLDTQSAERIRIKPALTTRSGCKSVSAEIICRSQSKRFADIAITLLGMPADFARSNTLALAWSEITQAISAFKSPLCCASITAWAILPLPEASMTMRGLVIV